MTNSCVDKIAVFDLGSARTKLLIGTRDHNGALRLTRRRVETGVEGKLPAVGRLTHDTEQALGCGLSELVTIARGAGCLKCVSIATEAFRSDENGPELIRIANDLVGPIVVLTPPIEGLLFYSALRQSLLLEGDVCAMDVGGGSVQVVWGGSEMDVACLPTGTFRLEREYHSGHTPTAREYAAMERRIRECIHSALPKRLTASTLVLGSNCMAEFLMSAMSSRKVDLTSREHSGPVSIWLEQISQLLEEIKGRPYVTLHPYYPVNPRFMFGADKALLNCIALAKFLHTDRIVPTDESVGTALVRLALLSPDVLGRYGIAIHEF